ncbi:Nif3-like dinuclear metal center hexameric protein [Bacillaceae bacterium S4-13-58]
MKIHDIIDIFEEWCPQTLAYDWDKVGLQVGSKETEVEKILITLDVREEVVDEAIAAGVQFIFAHHPLLFKPLPFIDVQDSKGRIIQKLIQNNISVYAAHTNLDVVQGGVNDLLAEKIGLKETKVLLPDGEEELYKLVIFVPTSHAEKVKEAIGDAGAGHIGNYSHCMFHTVGKGQFKPLEGTDPFLGTKGTLETVEEDRIETIVPKYMISNVLNAMREVHPYEEVAYDLYRLRNKGKVYGAGRIGLLEKPMMFEELLSHIKNVFKLPQLRFVGTKKDMVQKVAVLGGSGEDFIEAAKHAGADVYITGDLTFHDAQDAQPIGLHLIDPGHYIEEVMKEGVQHFFQSKFKTISQAPTVLTSKVNTNPFEYY